MRREKGGKNKLEVGGGTESSDMHTFPQTEALYTQTKDNIFFYVACFDCLWE